MAVERASVCLPLQRFSRSEDGGIAIVFGLALIAVAAIIGLAIDYGRASIQKTTLQGAVDASLLAGAAALTGNAEDPGGDPPVIGHNWTSKHPSQEPALTFSELAEGRLTVSARITMPTTFMAVLGKDSSRSQISSQVQYGINDAEVALVLDTTASMSPSMAALREAGQPAGRYIVGRQRQSAPQDRHRALFQLRQRRHVLPRRTVDERRTRHRHAGSLVLEHLSGHRLRPLRDMTGYNDGVPYEYQSCPVISYGDPVEVCRTGPRRTAGMVVSAAAPIPTTRASLPMPVRPIRA